MEETMNLAEDNSIQQAQEETKPIMSFDDLLGVDA